MSIGLLLEFIAFQENSLTRRKIMLLTVTLNTPTELMLVFSAVAQWAEVVYSIMIHFSLWAEPSL